MSEQEKMSYTAASTFPAKLFHSDELIAATRAKMIPPIHVQLVLTNKCVLNCPYCSCSKTDRTEELKYDEVINIMQEFKNVGCKAVTITGGGEPLCHPDFEEIITQIKRMGIEIGLVTNGVLLHKIDKSVLNQITWCRISHDDYRAFDEEYQEHLSKTVKDAYKVDWAFSYVLTRKPNFDNIASIIKFANGHKFTHVRIVSDLLDLGSVMNMDLVKMEMTKRGVDDHIVIYQGRKEWVKGAKKCYMSLLKPTVAANGMIAPCCGFQYKDEIPTRSYGKDGMMCNWTEIPEVWKKQEYYDGSVCKVCYYDDYNTALRIMISDLEHKVFI